MIGDDATQGAHSGAPPSTIDLGPPPEAVLPLAYSEHTSTMPVVDYRPPRSRPTWITGLAALAATGIAAAAFFLGRSTAVQPQATAPAAAQASTSTDTPAPPPASVPVVASAPVAIPAPAPPAAPVPTGPDAGFLYRMRADGVPYASGDDDAIVTAHLVCNSLSNGTYDGMQGQADSLEHLFGWTASQSWDFVAAAVRFYCPYNAR